MTKDEALQRLRTELSQETDYLRGTHLDQDEREQSQERIGVLHEFIELIDQIDVVGPRVKIELILPEDTRPLLVSDVLLVGAPDRITIEIEDKGMIITGDLIHGEMRMK